MTTHTAHKDNAGGIHISDGTTAWFLGFDYDAENLHDDLDAWASGDWEPNEDDGQAPETLAEYAEMAIRTDSERIA